MKLRRWGLIRVFTLLLLMSIASAASAQSAITTMVTHYYQSILRRAPDSGGLTFWVSEAGRMTSLGASINETWYAMGMSFFGSAEYASFNRTDNDFVIDLYQAFLNRAPDSGGLAYWDGQIASGMPRGVVLANFMFSPEFANFTQSLFGNITARAEANMAVDFYRGVLSRLPDTGGFNYWVEQFRHAQCQGASAVYSQVDSISRSFVDSAEYIGRGRTNQQFVGDMYNAILRRGGDLGGVQFWINVLNTGARTRDTVRQQFEGSPEFSQRVAAVIAQGCGGAPITTISLATSTPTALTPLSIVAAGIDSDAPITVSFDAAGYHASGNAIRASADGTVVIATPIYFDPGAHQFTSGTVAMTLAQGGITSRPSTLTIHALPTVASYGVARGQISHAMLAFQEVAIASRIDELQAYDLASNGKVDTSSTRAALFQKLIAVIEARNDIDRVLLNSSVSINNGTLSNGTPALFNSASLDMMDRTAAVFLMGILSDPNLWKSTATMSQIISLVSKGTGFLATTSPDAIGGMRAAQSAWKNCRDYGTAVGCVDDSLGAVGGGLSSAGDVLKAALGKGALPELLGQFGAVASAVGFSGELVNYWTLRGAESAPEPPEFLHGYSAAVGLANAFEVPVSLGLVSTASVALPFASGIVALTVLAYDEMNRHVQEQDAQAMRALADAAWMSQMIKGRVAAAKGIVSIANSQGIAAAQTGMELCGFGIYYDCVDTLADTAGNYTFTIPMGVPFTNYSSLSLSAYDPITNYTLSSSVVDLRGLNTNAPVSISTVTGACFDSDATSPDGDDPDCD